MPLAELMAARMTIRIGDNQKVEFASSFVGLTLLGLLRRAIRVQLANLFYPTKSMIWWDESLLDNRSLLNQALAEIWRPEARKEVLLSV